MKVEVKTLDNATAGEIELDEAIFAVPAVRDGVDKRRALLHRVVSWQLAKRRAGTHKTKTISEISGTGKKPFKQKGTGGARQGSRRSAQFRGGATIFGPRPRSYEHDLPKKVRRLALKHALSSKLEDGRLIVIESASVDSHKTREMVRRLSGLGITNGALVIDGETVDGTFALAIRNIPKVDALPTQGANVYDILRRDHLVLTRAAVAALGARLGDGAGAANDDAAPVDASAAAVLAADAPTDERQETAE